jgi:hypothetical protein
MTIQALAHQDLMVEHIIYWRSWTTTIGAETYHEATFLGPERLAVSQNKRFRYRFLMRNQGYR